MEFQISNKSVNPSNCVISTSDIDPAYNEDTNTCTKAAPWGVTPTRPFHV